MSTLNDPQALLVAIPGLLVAFNAFLKKMGMKNYWCPLVNLVGGFIALPFLLEMGYSLPAAILISMMIGLSAGGFYDFAQKTVRSLASK